jgi:hypothetical protein
VKGVPRSYAELKRLVDEYIEEGPANRVVPVAPDVVVSKALASCTTDLALKLHIAREQQLQAARAEFCKIMPANRRVELAADARLPPTVHGLSQTVGTLAAAGLTAGACVWSGAAVFKIVDPFFADATRADLVCLLYPVDAYEEDEEEAMKANPAAFESALLCDHARVLSWLGFLAEDAAEGEGAKEGEAGSGAADKVEDATPPSAEPPLAERRAKKAKRRALPSKSSNAARRKRDAPEVAGAERRRGAKAARRPRAARSRVR